MSTDSPRTPEPAKRTSHERKPLTHLRDALADLGVECVTGQGANNKYGIDGWGLSATQQFQFGDLRIELPTTTVLLETESAGGVGNLVKYWPLMRSRTLDKRIILIHLYMIGSDNDYIAHRKLWRFLSRSDGERPEFGRHPSARRVGRSPVHIPEERPSGRSDSFPAYDRRSRFKVMATAA